MEYLNKEIIEIANKLGIELIGFCELKYFNYLEDILKFQGVLGYKTSFQVGDIDDKVFKYSEYKSAIVIGIPYKKVNSKNVHFSSVAYGKDYHLVLKEKLDFISDYLKDKNYKTYVGVDNNIYDERYLAYKAGLGFYGKNNLLINEKYGSFFYIGIILTDALFIYNEEEHKTCYGCNKCIEACPTNALNGEILNGNICLSYLTQKKTLTDEEKKYINNCVYGCDICQNICPYNENVDSINNDINPEKFLSMSKEEYDLKYKENSSYWRGKKVIDRNINLYKENSKEN